MRQDSHFLFFETAFPSILLTIIITIIPICLIHYYFIMNLIYSIHPTNNMVYVSLVSISINLAILLTVLVKVVTPFTPHLQTSTRPEPNPKSSIMISEQRKTRMFSMSPIVNGDGQDLQVKQDVTKEALKKLLVRQQREIRQTETLIANLEQGQTLSLNKNITTSFIGDDEISSNSVMTAFLSAFDYGFVSRSEGCRFQNVNDFNEQLFEGYGPPANIFLLGSQQFMRNLNAMKGEYRDEDEIMLTKKQKELRVMLKQLTLNSTAIWEREKSRGPIIAPLIIKIPYYVLCYLLDVVFEGRYVPSRFFLLETVARMPYFSYITMLHLYESLGFWRRSKDVKRVHFAEEWNEFHHLLIMESLGGDQAWWVRFIAQHSAILYYIVLSILFAISPSLSYKFSELLETHAVDTYGQFLDENEKVLKQIPPSLAAVEYYAVGISDPMFGEYQTSAIASGTDIRKPGTNMTSLYDVFKAIRADEGDHVGTMKACLDPNVPVISPSLEVRLLTGLALSVALINVLPTDDLTDASPELVGFVESLPITTPIMPKVADTISSVMEKVGFDDASELGLRLPFMDGFAFEGLDSVVNVVLDIIRAIGLIA